MVINNNKAKFRINPKLNKEMKNRGIITPRQKAYFVQKIGLGWVNGMALERSMNQVNTLVKP